MKRKVGVVVVVVVVCFLFWMDGWMDGAAVGLGWAGLVEMGS